VVWKAKGKGKTSSSNQNEHVPFVMSGILSILEEISTTFIKVQLLKQLDKMKERSTVDMDEEELKKHRLALKTIQKDLNFMEAVVKEEKDMNEDEDK
jgi:predicted polyphosphate/ATP-dependent NAD kinase